MNTAKPGTHVPGLCLLSRGACRRGPGATARSVDRFQIVVSLVVERSCRRWHLGPGVKWDVPFGPGHLGRCNGRHGCCLNSLDTPGTSEIRRECWSRGRIVSALLAAAQGGCLPSVEPPYPVAATIGRMTRPGNRSPPGGHGSSPEATGLHKEGLHDAGSPRTGAGRRMVATGAATTSNSAGTEQSPWPWPTTPSSSLEG